MIKVDTPVFVQSQITPIKKYLAELIGTMVLVNMGSRRRTRRVARVSRGRAGRESLRAVTTAHTPIIHS